MSDRVAYVYGIVSAAVDDASAPAGLDDAPVRAEREGALAALVSALDARVYAGGEAEARAGDVSWVGPRAVAHDAVLTWASESGGVIPLPMFTMFSDASAVRAMLRERASALRDTLARVAPSQEYTIRLFRLDDVATTTLAAGDPALAALERQAAAASPGQRYLLERKLEKERAVALRRVGAEAASRAFDLLTALAADGVREPIAATPDGAVGTAVLDASFLVRRDVLDRFREGVAELARELEPRGFRLEFTGPWPPYHFVRDRA